MIPASVKSLFMPWTAPVWAWVLSSTLFSTIMPEWNCKAPPVRGRRLRSLSNPIEKSSKQKSPPIRNLIGGLCVICSWSSIWQIDDTTSSDFFRLFYESIGKGQADHWPETPGWGRLYHIWDSFEFLGFSSQPWNFWGEPTILLDFVYRFWRLYFGFCAYSTENVVLFQ